MELDRIMIWKKTANVMSIQHVHIMLAAADMQMAAALLDYNFERILTGRRVKKNNTMEAISITQLGRRPMHIKDGVALTKAEATERRAHSAPRKSDDQFVSNATHGRSLIETDTVHVFSVRPLSTVDIMFNWKYA